MTKRAAYPPDETMNEINRENKGRLSEPSNDLASPPNIRKKIYSER